MLKLGHHTDTVRVAPDCLLGTAFLVSTRGYEAAPNDYACASSAESVRGRQHLKQQGCDRSGEDLVPPASRYD